MGTLFNPDLVFHVKPSQLFQLDPHTTTPDLEVFIKKAQNVLETHPSQADPAGNFVGDVLPVDVSYPGAGDVLHATTAHPDLQAGIIQQRQRV